jgi:homoserine kinase
MVDNGLPVTVNFPLHPDWEILALVPDFTLPTSKARAALPSQLPREDAVYNIAHGAMVLKALELGDEKLLRNAMQDRLHQPYRKSMIADYEKIEALVRTLGAAFCLSGAGPTLLCITRDKTLKNRLESKLSALSGANWEVLKLHVEFEGARVVETA